MQAFDFGIDPMQNAIDELHAATALYTAETIVDDLLDRINWPAGSTQRQPRRLIDTSCGDGVFVGRALQRFLQTEPNATSTRLLKAICGWELHRASAETARARVQTIMRDHGWTTTTATTLATAMIRNRDFLTDGPSLTERYDVAIGNPPYLRRVNVPILLRDQYDKVVPEYAQGDMLHAFLERSSNMLAADGICVLVTADRWLFNSSASRLRAEIGQRLSVAHLTRLDAKTAFYRPKHRRTGSAPRVHPVQIILSANGGTTLDHSPMYPGADPVTHGSTKLADIAKITIAPWLGTPGIFVIRAKQAAEFPRTSLIPAIDTDDLLTDGSLRPASRYAIRTHSNREPPPAVAAHLKNTLPAMAARGHRTPAWLPPETWNDALLSQERLAVPCIARNLRVFRIPPGVLPISHNITVLAAGTKSLDEIETILRSPKTQHYVKTCAAPIENGYLRVTTQLIKNIPV